MRRFALNSVAITAALFLPLSAFTSAEAASTTSTHLAVPQPNSWTLYEVYPLNEVGLDLARASAERAQAAGYETRIRVITVQSLGKERYAVEIRRPVESLSGLKP